MQGVRPITQAVEHGWSISALIQPTTGTRSAWASRLLTSVDATRVTMAPELLRELSEKSGETPELIAVARIQTDELDRVRDAADLVVVVFDRPASPGNLGMLIRSADAFGAHGVVVTGHAADVYDPKTVRAGTGSVFAVPTVRVAAPSEVVRWARARQAQIVGTDESGSIDVAAHDFTGPTVIVIGNETTGMAKAWHKACDITVRIPIEGAASSLNAGAAATVVLYEAARQRRHQ